MRKPGKTLQTRRKYLNILLKRRKNVRNKVKRKVYVSVHKGLRFPTFFKQYMNTLTPQEENMKRRTNTAEVVSRYVVLFDKETLRIKNIANQLNNRNPISKLIKHVIEHAVQRNLNTLSRANREYILGHWNGYLNIIIKKEVSSKYYILPWHRDALKMEMMGKQMKSFAVGALYVSIPRGIGANIEFKRNEKQYRLTPTSGTSVMFIDDELFHRVTPIKAPAGMNYVPRQAMFLLYGTDTKTFKLGLNEGKITAGNRNYKAAYNRIPSNLKNLYNTLLANPNMVVNNNNKNRMNNAARGLFGNSNATYKNTLVLYANLKKAFGQQRPSVTNKSFIDFSKTVHPTTKSRINRPTSVAYPKTAYTLRQPLPQKKLKTKRQLNRNNMMNTT
jgi:hypothetical protein